MVIDTLQLDIIVNNKGTTARINNTTNALKNLHKVLTDINGAGGVDGVVNGGGGGGSSSRGGSSRSSGAKGATSLANNLKKSLNFGSMVAKLYFVRNITKQLGRDLAKVVQYGIDYEETLNLWQVAMKGNTAEARKFITEMNRAYGISEITLMNYQATFKNMLSSLGGINQEVAYGLSETLSQMALDYASLYNTSIESAMTKFQAVLAGQVRPIRSESGYDITQATLGEIYKDIGGTKTVRQLSETEKRLLRILAVYRQMKDTAVGDYAKTITSTANQTRYMSETIKDIATWIGVGANQWLKQSNILIRINAYLLALKELAKSFAINMGYVEQTEEKAQDPLAGMEEEWDGINKQVDEYKGKLLGFDKFQVLSSAEVGGDVDISAELLKAMQEYEQILKDTENIYLYGDVEKGIEGAYGILERFGFKLVDVVDEAGKTITDSSGNAVQVWVKGGETIGEIISRYATGIMSLASSSLIIFGALKGKLFPIISGIMLIFDYLLVKSDSFRGIVGSLLSIITKLLSPITEIIDSVLDALFPIINGLLTVVGWVASLIGWIVELLDKAGLLKATVYILTSYFVALGASNVIPFFANLASTIWTQTLPAVINFIKKIPTLITGLNSTKTSLDVTSVAALRASLAIGAAFGFIMLVKDIFDSWENMSTVERVISVIGALTVAVLGAAIAIGVFHSAWSLGLAVAGIAAGIIAVTSAVESAKESINGIQVSAYAKGGLAEKGSLFMAGEDGPELLTQTSGGGSTIMNMKQLEDAVARGFIRGFAATDNGTESDDTTEVYVDGQRLFNIMRNTAKRNGYDFVRV